MQKFNSYIIRHTGDSSPSVCSKCGVNRDISEYYTHSVRGDGAIRYRPYCKSCRRVRVRQQKKRPVHFEIMSKGSQVCKFCHNDKPLSEFYCNGCFPDGTKKYRSRCKLCVLSKLKINNKKNSQTKAERRSSSPKNFISGILNHSAGRKQNLGFNIDMGYLLQLYEDQDGFCAISGVKMTHIAGRGRLNTNISIDRIDSKRGYLRGNVQFVCDIVNRMKSDMREDELLTWCRRILEVSNGRV